MAVQTRVMPGGLLRCCLATLDEKMLAATELPREGDTIQCKYCKSENGGMIFRDGVWQWDQAVMR